MILKNTPTPAAEAVYSLEAEGERPPKRIHTGATNACAACAFAALLRAAAAGAWTAQRRVLSRARIGVRARGALGSAAPLRHPCPWSPLSATDALYWVERVDLRWRTLDAMNSLPERIMEWRRGQAGGHADTGGRPPAPRRPGGRGPDAILTHPFGPAPAGRPGRLHASDPDPVRPSRTESGAGPSSGRSDGSVPARSRGVWMPCCRSSRSARVRIQHRTIGRFQQTPKKSESPRWR